MVTKRTKSTKTTRKKTATKKPKLSPEEFYRQVSIVAYELYQKRGGEHGHDLDDWLEAERIVKEKYDIG